MKNIILIAAALLMTIAANAQRSGACTYNLERETFRGTGFRFVQSYTDFGRYACEDARANCQAAKRARAFSYEYRCEKDFVSRPAVRSCEFRIQTRRGYTTERFNVTGIRPCQTARQRCEDELSYQRRWGMVGRAAECVKTSGRNPAPRPGRLVTESCRAELLAGRLGRPTGNVYTGTGTARNYTEARQRACSDAISRCNSVARGTMRCEVIR